MVWRQWKFGKNSRIIGCEKERGSRKENGLDEEYRRYSGREKESFKLEEEDQRCMNVLEGDDVYIYMGNLAKIMFWPPKLLLFLN